MKKVKILKPVIGQFLIGALVGETIEVEGELLKELLEGEFVELVEEEVKEEKPKKK